MSGRGANQGADADVRRVASFLRPLVEIDLRPGEEELKRRRTRATWLGTARRRLPVELDDFLLAQQTQSNWCWAAVGIALQLFFRTGEHDGQCELAQAVLRPQASCCEHPSDPACNRVARMSELLAVIGVRRRSEPRQPTTPIAFDTIAEDLSTRLPIVCLMTHRPTGTTHFMVLVGADLRDGEQWVAFDDPGVGGRYWRPLAVFQNNFRGWFWEQSTRLAR